MSAQTISERLLNPIFKEYIQFLNDTSKNKPPELEQLKEGYFWLDKSIIKCFDKQGNEHKILRVNIHESLTFITLTRPKTGYSKLDDIELASWEDLIENNIEHLREIESESLNLIRDKLAKYDDYTPITPISTGKDSMITDYLVRTVKEDVHDIFNNSTLDCAETYKMAKAHPNCELMSPDEGFYQYIERDNVIPTRFARFCCRIFKVGEMVKRLDHNKKYLFFMGMRNEESDIRSDYGDEWVNSAEWGDTEWQGILPIRKWTEMDVWLYTFWKKLEINPKYRKGYSRVGCAIACPYYTKSTWILDVYWYPTMRKRWEEILRKDFINNKKWIVMNCTIEEYITAAWNGGAYRSEPTEAVIKEYAKCNDLEIDVATKYFNKVCSNGCKNTKGKELKIKDKAVLGMNMKLYGRQIEKFKCKKCLMSELGWNKEEWNNQVARFKDQGCKLF
jgi:3'-phosphoadenosine 5'-phosphosulfate sulfotransferase (PAPS reductase)/FAD synthetase